jgi:prolyl oligopeptidase
MLRLLRILNHAGALGLVLSLFLSAAATAATPGPALQNPAPAPVRPVTELVCGTSVVDSYRYMENLHDPAVRTWFTTQSDYARAVLDRIPGRKGLLAKMEEFDRRQSARVYRLVITDNDLYFYLKQTPADQTGKLYVRNGFSGRETLLFDPATLAGGKGSVYYTIGTIVPTDDGSRVTFGVAANGSEAAQLLIMDVAARTLYPERIDRCRFASPSWLADGSAFLYNRLRPSVAGANPQYDSAVWLHRVGTAPAEDREIFSRALYPGLGIRPEEIPRVIFHKESNCLFGFVDSVDRRLTVYYAPAGDLDAGTIAWKKLISPADEIHDLAPTGRDLYLLSSKNAPNFKILKTPLAAPDPEHAEVVVPEARDSNLSDFVLTSDGICFSRSRNGVSEELFFQPYGSRSPREISLPFKAGTLVLSSKGFRFPDLWVVLSGWDREFSRYRFDRSKGTFARETLSSPAEYPEYRDLVVEEKTCPSYDGIEVPLSLIYRKGLERDGNRPVLMYGYGAYGISMTPFFSPDLLLWTREGGILAVLHVRGGGELGDAWHTAGMKATKPNTWKDAIASADYLVRHGYTAPKRIVLYGGSAGGILVGRAMTERPDLFAAVVPQVGVMNPLRSEHSPNGPVNIPEFGSVTQPEECRALVAMDSCLHIRDGVDYPAALITAGLNDPRVAAWEPAKFAARLQAATASGRPVLFLANADAGHGIGNTKALTFQTLADVLSFALWQTGQPGFQIP